MPPTPWTDTEPPGSSTSMRSSKNSIEKVMAVAAIEPITAASAGLTNAHEALLATSPPTQPLAVSDASGLPKRTLVINAAVRAEGGRGQHGIDGNQSGPRRKRSAPVKRIAPAEFSPIQPIRASTQPNSTRTTDCGRELRGPCRPRNTCRDANRESRSPPAQSGRREPGSNLLLQRQEIRVQFHN